MDLNQSLQNGQYNIGYLCTGLQCSQGNAKKTAMRFIAPDFKVTDYSFKEMDVQSNLFANALNGLGVASGDVVFTFLPKAPEQFFAFLGALKVQAICGTLFSNFGDDALLDRLSNASPKVIVTKKVLAKKVLRIAGDVPSLKYIVVIDIDDDEDQLLSYKKLTKNAPRDFDVPTTGPETPSVLHYTSGSTGKPKGVLHKHGSIISQVLTGREVLGLGKEDVYWCTADQGWVTGTSYGIITPWALGVTQIHFSGQFDKDVWYRVLRDAGVTCWYTAPTALRMLMKADPSAMEKLSSATLKRIYSVGEPLNPEVMAWGEKVFYLPIYDTWFQTETGAIMITNCPGVAVKPGSMGKPVSGITPAIVDDSGRPCRVMEKGNLCIAVSWPSLFTDYLNNTEAYLSKFKDGLYWTGDTAYFDEDGHFWFCGRSDDVINTSGHLVSPFEVESALLEVDEVAESGVVGLPDKMLFEKIVAFVALNEGCSADRKLETRLKVHVSKSLSSIAVPQEIVFVPSVPKNKSGKIMRRVLRARYLGEDEGDISTLEI